MLYRERKVDTIKKVKILYRSPQALSNTKAIQFIKNNLEEIKKAGFNTVHNV